jgi:O-antigen/teichoic acid export membrane protein
LVKKIMKLFDIPVFNRLMNYSWGAVFNKLLIFLLLPVISRSLKPEEFAVYSIMLLFAAIASHCFQLGLHQSLLTLYYKQPDNAARLSLISTTWHTVTINATILSAIIFIFRKSFAQLMINSPNDFSILICLTLVIIIFDVFSGLVLVLLNIRQQSREYSILNLTKNIVTLLLVLIFSLLGSLDIFKFFIILAVSSIASYLHSLFFFRIIWRELSDGNKIYQKFSVELFRDIIRFGIFMVPATFAVISLQSADRYMLNLLSPRTLYDAGIYAIAYKIGMIITLFTVVFDLLFFPYIMQIKDLDYAKRQLKKLFNFYSLSACLIAVCIIIFSREIFLVLDSSYQEGASLVFFGVISMFLRGLSNILILGFYILKRSESIALASVLAALINIFLNWLWIPGFGMLGAGFASIIAYLFIVLVNYITVEKAFKVGYNAMWIFISLFVMLIASFINLIAVNLSISLFITKISVLLMIFSLTYLYLSQKGYLHYIISKVRGKDEV